MNENKLKTTDVENEETLEEPIYVEPSKDIKIGDLDITLCNELIQKINDELHLSFTCEQEIDVIKEAFETNKNPIVYDTQSYTGYTIIKEFGFKVDNENKTIYHVSLLQPEEDEVTPEMKFAIQCAIPLMTNGQIIQCVSVLTEWEKFIGGKMEANQRFKYKGEPWQSRQEISVVLENQPPAVETAALYERIESSHTGSQEYPIPYSPLMRVYKDKYYTQNDVLYLCIEDSGQPLYADCKDLPRYFQKVEA